MGASALYGTSIQEYKRHYPQFFEYCFGTQIKFSDHYNNGDEGNPGGHGLFYVEGLCKDQSKDYPQVKPCDSSDDHTGVGVSLDSGFKNVAWIAVPGRDLFLDGGIKRSQQVNKQTLAALLQKSVDEKIMKNVELHADIIVDGRNSSDLKFGTTEYEKFATEFMVGTDIAFAWGRDLRCVKIPILKSKIGSLVKMLNDLNNKYYLDSNKDYTWKLLYNNCTHLAINASAALGLNEETRTDASFLQQISHFQVPANAFMQYTDIALMGAIDAESIAQSKRLTGLLNRHNYLPTAYGGLISKYSVFKNNLLFKTEDLAGIAAIRKKTLVYGAKALVKNILDPFRVLFDRGDEGEFKGLHSSEYEKLFSQGFATDLEQSKVWWNDRYHAEIEKLNDKRSLTKLERELKAYYQKQIQEIN
jgi:hypothetical protein